ncbi:molybdopterin-dependent oxidoreductase [Campylobacter mucosalis]|uniref:molybdopterin-dependent oxidoreductase n=1 Tax=Campylobacter mucosalis TaxID=202 RepID=UPI00146FCF30|nr:molybdopterin-dependent oxidoreductase [Campylobacter mucosalis]
MQRRKFLQLSLATASVAYATNLGANLADKKTLSANKFGVFWVHTNGDKITKTTPFEDEGKANKLNEILPELLEQNKTRIHYPYVRKSFLQDPLNSKPELRGKDEFVRVSWNEAIELSAKMLKYTYETYGANAVYGQVYQWGNLGKVGHSRNVGKRMLNVLGGYVSESGGYSYGCEVIMPHVIGTMETRMQPSSWKAIIENAKNIVFWGTDPIVSNELGIGAPLRKAYKDYQIIKDMHENGKIKIYSVDVYKNETANYFNADTIIIRPNTDTAMMIAMCQYLYVNKLYDQNFIEKNCVGFDKFRSYFMGESDGVLKDMAWASKICNISKDALENFITKIAKDKTMIVSGYAIQRQDHGEQAFWALIVLNAMLGWLGKAGGGFMTNDQMHKTSDTHYQAPKIKAFDVLPHDEKFRAMIDPKGSVIPNSRIIEALERPGDKVEKNGKIYTYPDIKLFFSTNGSLFTRHQDANRALKAFKKLQTIITLEPYWTSQAKFSDIVLPVSIQPEERIDIDFANSTNEYLFAIKPSVKSIGESKSDFWICNEICKKFGLELAFNEGKDELGWVKEIYSSAQKKGKDLGYDMPNFDEFWEKGYFKFDKVDNKKSNLTTYVDFRNDPKNNKLNTPSGKIEIFSQTIADMGYDDCPGHPTWLEPLEWLGDENKKYPLAVVSAHSKYRLHSQLDNSEILRKYSKISSKEPVMLSPNLAKLKGIKDGDIVKVFNDRGAILCGALISNDIPDDVLIIREGAWWSPDELGVCHSGNVNVLTPDKGSSKLAQSNIAHTCLADIQKFVGISINRAYEAPKIID